MAAVSPNCPRCLRAVGPENRFCPTCGARLWGPPRSLRRLPAAGKLGGVCAGLAEYFDLDVTLVRALFAVGSFFSGVLPGLILYLILVAVLPVE